jgi:hypothetical protein
MGREDNFLPKNFNPPFTGGGPMSRWHMAMLDPIAPCNLEMGYPKEPEPKRSKLWLLLLLAPIPLLLWWILC